MSEATEEEVMEIAGRLYAYSELKPDTPYWLCGADEGQDYCYECASARLAAGEGECLGGGLCGVEADTSLVCADCGRLLNYWLTKHGVESELDHYKYWRSRNPLMKGDAWCIARLVECAPTNKSAVRLGRRVASVLGDAK